MSYRLGALPNTYRYNGQTAFALVPALLVLAGFGGQVVMGTFMVGGMITYILDAMQYREGSFASLWITLVAANLGLLMANDTFSPLRFRFRAFLPARIPSHVSLLSSFSSSTSPPPFVCLPSPPRTCLLSIAGCLASNLLWRTRRLRTGIDGSRPSEGHYFPLAKELCSLLF